MKKESQLEIIKNKSVKLLEEELKNIKRKPQKEDDSWYKVAIEEELKKRKVN